VYFGGKLVRKEYKPYLQDGRWVYYGNQPSAGATLATDRLGSVQTGSQTTYYPYGEERTLTNNDTQKFATYTRDRATGLDYANARYYSSQIARFTIPDPSASSVSPVTPQSWNRYSYVRGDPANSSDPSGLVMSAKDCIEDPEACEAEDWGIHTGVAIGGGLGGAGGALPGWCGVTVAAGLFGTTPVTVPCTGTAAPSPRPTIPTCADNLNAVSPGWTSNLNLSTVTWRILNENSFNYLGFNSYQAGNGPNPMGATGPLINWDTLFNEDIAIASVIVNLANTPTAGKPDYGSIFASAYQNGNFSNAYRIAIRAFTASDAYTNECFDMIIALTAASLVLTNGSQVPIYYNNWRGVLQDGTVYPPNGCQFQINNTKFLNYKDVLPCTP
jgi:RHS repeat-associated protein